MGKPGRGHALSSRSERIAPWKPTGGSEPSQYPQERKAISDSVSSGERTRNSPNREGVKPASVALPGLWDVAGSDCSQAEELQITSLVEGSWKGPPKRVTAP